MRIVVLPLLAVALLFGHQPIHAPHERDVNKPINRAQNHCGDSLINDKGKTILTRFKTPDGYWRTTIESGSFGSYLRNLPLKPHGSDVLLFDGSVKPGENKHVAVVKMDIGNKDLQQCADAIIRLRAEYLFQQNQFEKISFHFTNGEKADYLTYAAGYRVIDIETTKRLTNPKGDTPWYPLALSGKLVTPDWIFDYDDLKRFNDGR